MNTCPHCGKPESWVAWSYSPGTNEWMPNLAMTLVEVFEENAAWLERYLDLRWIRSEPNEIDVCAHCGEVVT